MLAAAAAQSMQDQAGKLMQVVGMFRLDGMQAMAASARVIPLAIGADDDWQEF